MPEELELLSALEHRPAIVVENKIDLPRALPRITAEHHNAAAGHAHFCLDGCWHSGAQGADAGDGVRQPMASGRVGC